MSIKDASSNKRSSPYQTLVETRPHRRVKHARGGERGRDRDGEERELGGTLVREVSLYRSNFPTVDKQWDHMTKIVPNMCHEMMATPLNRGLFGEGTEEYMRSNE